MKSRVDRIGTSQSVVMTVDDFTDAVPALIDYAAGMAPLPAIRGNSYPGLRRVITPIDGEVYELIERLVREAAPLINEAFEIDGFDMVEASFSMVTTSPANLAPQQRAPHFDSTDPGYFAFLLYLSDTPHSGTAFYRQRATGIEAMSDANLRAFVNALPEREFDAAYIDGSTDAFEQIHSVSATPGRLVVYRGCLLHSGIIPPNMEFSDDPRRGRLTLNLFLQAR